MTQNAIVGYPRVGAQGEFKYLMEAYAKGNISGDILWRNANQLKKEQWLQQEEKEIDFIPSNDFSFYDSMLDTAYLLNAVPKVYQDLSFNELDTCFSMARGFQSEMKDVKPLSIRKWFNTNDRYMVPVLDDTTEIQITGSKPFEQFLEALTLGFQTKPVLVGPFTFLKLSDCSVNKKKKDFTTVFVKAYQEIFYRLGALGAQWLQLDEPALTGELKPEDMELFVSLYRPLLKSKERLRILLQTYFGDICDVYRQVVDLGFDGIGLDFVEGKKSKDLIKTYGFPSGTLLFAGVVSGKSICKNDYAKTLQLLHELEAFVPKKNIVISTSCSFLPLTSSLEHEETKKQWKRDHKYHRAFAQDKLRELADLKRLFDDEDDAAAKI